jgi:hypothetical protein
MGLNSEQEKQSLKNSLRNTEDLNQTVFCLECVLKYKTPFALYIATADRSDCSWIFDPLTVYAMLGGEDKYNSVYDSMVFSEEEKETQVLFFIFKKVGPIYSIRVDIELIDEIINELYDEL